jgi:hypothetical protein
MGQGFGASESYERVTNRDLVCEMGLLYLREGAVPIEGVYEYPRGGAVPIKGVDLSCVVLPPGRLSSVSVSSVRV